MIGRKTKGENMEHTKGPWEVEGEGQDVVGILAVNDNHYVAKLSGWEHSRQDANARLIAASPDLLEACKRIRDNALADDPNDWELLDVAIAKAEGRS